MKAATTKEATWNRYDSFGSTYKHVAYMINPDGTTIVITGYSKPETRAEKYDKAALLEGMIRRFVKNGYVFGLHHKYQSRTAKMEWYLNGSYTGSPDELLFTLESDNFKVNPEYVMEFRLQTMLTRLYEQARKGEIIQKSLRHKPVGTTQEQIFDLSKGRFKNESELFKFIVDAERRELAAPGRIHQFYIEYRNKWFE